MNTRYIRLTGTPDDEEAIRQAGEIVKNGGLAAFPTETVYGLGGDAFNRDAARKIYAAKGRPSDNPLIVHIAHIDALDQVAAVVPDAARALAQAYWPGPLTMIFHKNPAVPDETTGGRATVAVRFPDQPTAQAFIEAAGGFVCAPSANISGRPSPTNGRDVLEDMNGRIEAVIDDGEAIIGLESTIVDMTEEPPVLLRPGAITPAMLRAVVPDIVTQMRQAIADEAHPRAPGMKYRHYAPKAPLHLIRPGADMQERICRLARQALQEGKRTGILTCREHAADYGKACGGNASDGGNTHGESARAVIKILGNEHDEAEMGRNLFRCLREFDREGVDVIYSETFTGEGIGLALMNRLEKAANAKGEEHV